jgi:ATP-dependent DNA helicase PIF1
MRNIDQAAGLCNGTRVTIDDLGKNFIGATVITGKNAGEKILIPRMNLIPSDPGLPFKFMRRQYPLTLCFSMTINKSQGQSLPHVGIYLPKPVFTHGQLYVALSRVTSRKGLKLLILNEDGEVVKETVNVVYREVFANL